MLDGFELRDYQVADLAFLMSMPKCGLLSDPGTGKTAPVCVYIWWRWTDQGIRSIWSMPKSLLKKNFRELLVCTDLKPEDICIVGGSPARRLKQMATDAKVFLMGFDCFAREWEKLVEFHPDIDMLIVDEWHMGFKGDGSQRTQSLYRFMDRTTYMVAMTGTLVDGRMDAAYPFLHITCPGAYIGGWLGFVMRHGVEDDYGRVVAWQRGHEVGALLRQVAIRHTFEEVYGPEAKVIIHELCEMDPVQREAYNEFEETALLELEDSWLDGTLPGVNLIRCRQLMEHPQTFGEPLDKIKLTGKEERLMIHLEDHKNTGKPLVIFSCFTPQHDRLVEICKKMGFRVAMIDGRVSDAKRGRIDEDFQAGLYDIVVASAATAGVGFNWPHVDHVIFMSMDFMDSSFMQAYRRAIRGKRETPLMITVMEYENSVDQKVFIIIEKKSAMGKTVDPTREKIKLRGDTPQRNKSKPEPKPVTGFSMKEIAG